MQDMNKDPVAVYIHIPFCPSKCGYCDFNSFAMEGEIKSRTSRAIANEIRRSVHAGRPAKTIFFGGGTPTHIDTDDLIEILRAAIETHPPIEGCEITSEANPGTTDITKFKAMKLAGFNRLSIGAQSFAAADLRQLGRVHGAADPARAVGEARRAGFDNINLDLMFALPGQYERAWELNLKTALDLQVPHLSLYCLTIEPETRFYRQNLRGMLDLPDDESQTRMYEKAIELTARAGLDQYEISNFAKHSYMCQHNLAYWNNEDYIGYGPGAVGCVTTPTGRIRATNLKHPERYSVAVESGEKIAYDEEFIDHSTQQFERLMLGLRLNQGVPRDRVRLDPRGLATANQRGWIEADPKHIRLTASGRHFCSEVTLLLAPEN